MKAMILAAGRGERMRPLTDTCPKPLLPVGGRPLIGWHLARLAAAGFREVVINHAWLGDMIERTLGDGSAWGLSIRYSPEGTALETAGGIATALPLLGDAPFLVINGDVFCDWDPGRASGLAEQMRAGALDAWCVLIDNPDHNPGGDFGIDHGFLCNDAPAARPVWPGAARMPEPPGRLTFAGIGVYHPRLFAGIAPGTRAPLAPLLRAAADGRRAGAERYAGRWVDVGTPERLADLDAQLTRRPPAFPGAR